jgi:glycosyltransferase involved in cell wall biosynthesis
MANSSEFALSLVVCTRNRAIHLLEALRSMERISARHPWELILVDNASSDRTSAILQAFALDTQLPTSIAYAPKPGLSFARNVGWRKARAPIVAFTDDDCYPSEDFVDSVLDRFHDPQIGYLGGRVLLYDPDDYPISIQESEQRMLFPPRSFIEPGLIHGANFAFRNEVLRRMNGFDTRLGAGTKLKSGEDCDALYRASMHGFLGAYEPSVVVFHHHRRRQPEEIDRLRLGYDIGRGAYFAKALLSRVSRATYARHWYWIMRRYVIERRFVELARELRGGVYFLWLAIWKREDE